MSSSISGPNDRIVKKKVGKYDAPPEQLLLAAMGMEAEFGLRVDGQRRRPEKIFGDPRSFLGDDLMHRTGRSFHLRSGGAVYFDTGVIEVATPAMEIEKGCAARVGRSLWEGILEVRDALDGWEENKGKQAALTGFSTHYNVSFELSESEQGQSKTVEKLAVLLTHLLPAPVMVLATNRESTGVGIRPRGDRIEVTADFTPSPALMIATGTLIVGIIREVMTWPTFDLEYLDEMKVPRFEGFVPSPHTSRKGWLAHATGYPENPFKSHIDEHPWKLTDGEVASLREIARRITNIFWHPIRRISDPFTFRMIESVMRGRAPSLLDLERRPDAYDDVGRLCRWDNLFPDSKLSRSRYERVLTNAISGRRLRLADGWYMPVGMRGWSGVIFRRETDGARLTLPIDMLVSHLNRW